MSFYSNLRRLLHPSEPLNYVHGASALSLLERNLFVINVKMKILSFVCQNHRYCLIYRFLVTVRYNTPTTHRTHAFKLTMQTENVDNKHFSSCARVVLSVAFSVSIPVPLLIPVPVPSSLPVLPFSLFVLLAVLS